MSWVAWTLIAYIVIDRLWHVAHIGHAIELTPGTAIIALIAGALHVWAILVLAGVA